MHSVEIDNVLPRVTAKGYQHYIVHMYGSAVAFLMTVYREDVVEAISNANLEIMEIKIERNIRGLNDYRIVCRAASR